MYPNFICVGAQKAGTTAFYDLIKNHPDIELSAKKEIHFFEIDKNFNKGLDWYSGFFSNDKNKLKGEVTPDYMLYNHVPERIHQTLGKEVKLIFLLRNPILRAYSQFNFHQMKGVENRRDFQKVIENETIDYTNDTYNNWYDPAYYLSRGLYYNQIKRYLKYFSIEQMHFQLYEELFDESKQAECLKEVFKFLGVSDFKPEKAGHSNVTKVPTDGLKGELLFKIKQSKSVLRRIKALIPDQYYHYLRATLIKKMEKRPDKLSSETIVNWNKKYFYEDIQNLEKLIQKDCSIWFKQE